MNIYKILKFTLVNALLCLTSVVNAQNAQVLGYYNSSATTITLTYGQGNLLPTPPFVAGWWNIYWPSVTQDPYGEKVDVVGKNGDTLTVIRGCLSTAYAHDIEGASYVIAGTDSTPIPTNTFTSVPTSTSTIAVSPTNTPILPTFTWTPGGPTATFTNTPTPGGATTVVVKNAVAVYPTGTWPTGGGSSPPTIQLVYQIVTPPNTPTFTATATPTGSATPTPITYSVASTPLPNFTGSVSICAGCSVTLNFPSGYYTFVTQNLSGILEIPIASPLQTCYEQDNGGLGGVGFFYWRPIDDSSFGSNILVPIDGVPELILDEDSGSSPATFSYMLTTAKFTGSNTYSNTMLGTWVDSGFPVVPTMPASILVYTNPTNTFTPTPIGSATPTPTQTPLYGVNINDAAIYYGSTPEPTLVPGTSNPLRMDDDSCLYVNVKDPLQQGTPVPVQNSNVGLSYYNSSPTAFPSGYTSLVSPSVGNSVYVYNWNGVGNGAALIYWEDSNSNQLSESCSMIYGGDTAPMGGFCFKSASGYGLGINCSAACTLSLHFSYLQKP